MDVSPTPSRVLGPAAAELLERDNKQLARVLESLRDEDWRLKTAFGDTLVVDVVEHLAEDADRLAAAWEKHYEQGDEPLFHALEDPREHATIGDDVGAQEVFERYQEAMERLQATFNTVRQDDWLWPSKTPAGDVETFAEAVRRWLAHHYVHRQDIQEVLGRTLDRHDDTVRLVVEFVLDVLARLVAEAVSESMEIEVVTVTPGAGTWRLVVNDPEADGEPLAVWQELLGWRPDERPPPHRLERGHANAPRIRVRADGEQVWRAGFGRGGRWQDIEVHGDDEALDVWQRLVGTLDKRGIDEALGSPPDEAP